MEFPRKEYWSGLPFPSPGDRPNPGIEPTHVSCITRLFFTAEPAGKPVHGTLGAGNFLSLSISLTELS